MTKAANKLIPSTALVPFPNSSIKSSDFSVQLFKATETDEISYEKQEESTLSVTILVKILSKIPIEAL